MGWTRGQRIDGGISNRTRRPDLQYGVDGDAPVSFARSAILPRARWGGGAIRFERSSEPALVLSRVFTPGESKPSGPAANVSVREVKPRRKGTQSVRDGRLRGAPVDLWGSLDRKSTRLNSSHLGI